jgi:Domain of unknown function (DUF4864)
MTKTAFSRLCFLSCVLSWSLVRGNALAAGPSLYSPLSGTASTPALSATLRVGLPAGASALSAEDEKKIRSVVQGQLDALAKDDAAKAFSFAAPNVREAFGTAPRFLAMVQHGYPVVYRPASVAFLKVEGKDKLAFQRVQMTDQAGEPWLATYSLERQKNGLWRITGCSVVENRGRMT